jgi:hypothetical protein
MLKNLCELSHKVENKVCRFVCDNDTPTNFIKEALFQFQKYIGQIEDAAAAQQKAQAESLVPPVEPIVAIDPDVPAPEGNQHV